MWLQDVQSGFPSGSEGVKVTSCLVLTEAVKQPALTRHLTALRVGEFEVAKHGGIWVAIRGLQLVMTCGLACQVVRHNAETRTSLLPMRCS
jgi:hypothetical protein